MASGAVDITLTEKDPTEKDSIDIILSGQLLNVEPPMINAVVRLPHLFVLCLS